MRISDLFRFSTDNLRRRKAQSRARAEIPGQGSGWHGQTFQKGRKMKTVRHKTGEHILPGVRAHKVHGLVPLTEHLEVCAQRLQGLLRHVRACGRRQPGQFLPVYHLSLHGLVLLLYCLPSGVSLCMPVHTHSPADRDLQAPRR